MRFKAKLDQLFQANANRGQGLTVKAADDDASATVFVYDAIGGFFGISAQDFARELQAITAPVINLRVNSPGGDVFEARAMKTALEQHSAKVIAHVDGLAASAASFLIMGAAEIEMSDGAFLMIHKAWGITIDNADGHREMADLLDKVDGTIMADYEKRISADRDQLEAWMAAETWFTAAEAEEHGFIDRIIDGAGDDDGAGNRFDLEIYDHVPDALKPPAPEAVQAQAYQNSLRRLQFLNKTAA